jgi:hypothetical protein
VRDGCPQPSRGPRRRQPPTFRRGHGYHAGQRRPRDRLDTADCWVTSPSRPRSARTVENEGTAESSRNRPQSAPHPPGPCDVLVPVPPPRTWSGTGDRTVTSTRVVCGLPVGRAAQPAYAFPPPAETPQSLQGPSAISRPRPRCRGGLGRRSRGTPLQWRTMRAYCPHTSTDRGVSLRTYCAVGRSAGPCLDTAVLDLLSYAGRSGRQRGEPPGELGIGCSRGMSHRTTGCGANACCLLQPPVHSRG